MWYSTTTSVILSAYITCGRMPNSATPPASILHNPVGYAPAGEGQIWDSRDFADGELLLLVATWNRHRDDRRAGFDVPDLRKMLLSLPPVLWVGILRP